MKDYKIMINGVKRLLGQDVTLEQMPLDNGTVIEADVFEAGSPVFIVTEDGQVPLPVGDYTLEDGRMLVVAEDGMIAEIKDAAATEAEVEVEVEATSEDPQYVTKEAFDAAIGDIKSMLSSHFEKEVKEEVKEEVEEVELSADPIMPAATPIKPNPERSTKKAEQVNFSTKRKPSIQDRMMATFSNLNLS